MAIRDRHPAHDDIVRRFVAFQASREIVAVLTSRVQDNIFEKDPVAIAANANGRLRKTGAHDISQDRIDMRRARLMLEETQEVISVAVADRNSLVHRACEVERLPGPLEIEV